MLGVYETLSKEFEEILNSVSGGAGFEPTRVQNLMLWKSPFAQLQLCLYSTVFTAIELPVHALKLVKDHSLRLMETIMNLYAKLPSQDT